MFYNYGKKSGFYSGILLGFEENDYNQKVSLSTIINRAKANGFYLLKPERKAHDREVITNYPGELIQHDPSRHQFSIYADSKWYLIISLDDLVAFYFSS